LTGPRLLLLAVALAFPAAGARAQATAAGPAPAGVDAPDPAAEARAAYRRGADLYRAGRYREAIAEFEAAERLKESPALQFNIGQSWEKLGDVEAALAAFARYLRLDPRAPNREAVERNVKALEGRLAATGRQMLHVLTDPPLAEVAVDGAPAGRSPVDAAFRPGPHVVTASAPRRKPARRDVVLLPQRSLEVRLDLEPLPPAEPGAGNATPAALAATPPAPPLEATRPAPAPEPAEQRSWLGPIIAGSVGVVAAGAGVVMGLQARNAQNALLAGGNDRAQADALQSKARSDATTANVLYGVAGAAVLTGGVLAIAF
jgi:tetratricopeptide (TPR) repeat protein